MKSLRYSGKQKRHKRIVIRQVQGESMAPTLRHGQLVVGWRSPDVRLGDVVIVDHDGLEKIKRIEKQRDGSVYVLGDNAAASTDSRNYGWLPAKSIVAKVVWPKL